MITSFLFQSATPFPLDEIRAHLDALSTVRRDRWDEDVYIIADDTATLQSVIDARQQKREGYPRVVSLVALYETHIDFSLQARDLETVRAFARWLRTTYNISILDETFRDITAACDDKLDHLFGKPRKRRLLPVGFFRELEHGRKNGPSLREAMRDRGSPNEASIAAYLRGAPILLYSLGPVKDVLTPKGEYICAPNIHTDGVYSWPEDLAYYVERYHVELPMEFVTHVAASGGKAPVEVDTSLVELG